MVYLLQQGQGKPAAEAQWELACIEIMVPRNHLLRAIHEHIDFSFIYEKVRPYYSQTYGRPSVDPVLLFKMMLVGYLYGIPSERQLEQEVHLNIAYRWFLGLGLHDAVPDHSTISWNRKNRFQGSRIFQEIFDEVVQLAINHRMVGGRLLFTDSTHIQANANKNRYATHVVTHTPQSYVSELEQAVNEDRESHGKKPLPPAAESMQEEPEKQRVSRTDPDSGWLKRPGKPECFAYLDHRTVDHKFNLITDAFVTAGNVNDSVVYIERLKRQLERFNWHDSLESVGLDSGYMTPYICKSTLTMKLAAAIVEREAPAKEGTLPKEQFSYDPARDVYRCPQGEVLHYKTTNRKGYKEYKSAPATCAACPLLDRCTGNANKQRTIQRHVWEEAKEAVIAYTQSAVGRQICQWRNETIERSFADAKVHHGLRRCRMRGKEKVQEQVLMTAIAQNLKKIARHLASRSRKRQADNSGGFIALFVRIVFCEVKIAA